MQTLKTIGGALFVVFLACAVVGCESAPSHGQGDARKRQPGCSSDLECPAGNVCVRTEDDDGGGACFAGECNVERGCLEGYICITSTNRCALERLVGCAQVECPEGFECSEDDGACTQITDVPCVSHDECSNGLCLGGVCKVFECASDRHCDENQVCNVYNQCEDVIIECRDFDGDGYGIGLECAGPDCNDNQPNVHPGILEDGSNFCDDGLDNDCDGIDIACDANDADQDGYTIEMGDCDDSNPSINPGRSEKPYNYVDDDCNPDTSDGDLDGDGWASDQTYGRAERMACRADCDSAMLALFMECLEEPAFIVDDELPADEQQALIEAYCADQVEKSTIRCFLTCRSDCDDGNALINPGAMEIPRNGVDENCDGLDRLRSSTDEDGDGFTEQNGDCLEGDPTVNPSANEIPYNGRDDDCNPATLDDDLDEDSYGVAEDCEDTDPAIHPGNREVYYNGIEDDCDPLTKDDDADGDGHIASELEGDDCNDRIANVNPRAPEIPYNGIDDDCNPDTPDDDIDQDGVPLELDCDDNDRLISPNAVENTRENCSDGINHDCKPGDELGDIPCGDAIDNDGDGLPDELDCEPLNPTVPGPREILGNAIDDDCNPDTSDLLGQCVDDNLDNERGNGSRERATRIEDGNTTDIQYQDLVLCPYDEDWYVIDIQPGDGLEVDLIFKHLDGDIDAKLWRVRGDSSLELLDTSRSSTDNETVYARRDVGGASRYYIQVYRPKPNDEVYSYGMTVHVFESCMDDARGTSGEHNDRFKDAAQLPPFGHRRQICDFDPDWYRFSLSEQEDTRLELLFDGEFGDLDMSLHDADGVRLSTSATITSNENILMQLPPGEYFVNVYGFLSARNEYVLLHTDKEPVAVQAELDNEEPVALDDYRRGRPGVTTVEIEIEAPEEAVIHKFTIKNLKIAHTFLNDLRITLLWDEQPVTVLWDRQGEGGRDGGLDDDFMPFTSNDITFKSRSYSAFAGLSAQGTLALKVEDMTTNHVGTINNFEVTLDYVLPPNLNREDDVTDAENGTP